MIYTTIDTFYLSEEELKASPSRRDGIDENTETNLRFFGTELIQQAGILLKLPQAVMVTGQVLFHRFYCKKSLMKFNVKRVAASCLYLAGKLEESPSKIRDLLQVFHRIEQRRENLPITFLEIASKQYDEMKTDLIRTERHLLKEMGFICHVEHPHKFILSYLNQLNVFEEEVRQQAWNIANDSLRTTLCVRFKSEIIACGIVFFVTKKFCISLPELPPWWIAFDATKKQICDVCNTLIWLYSQPKANYVNVKEKKEGEEEEKSFVLSTRAWEPTPPLQDLPSLLKSSSLFNANSSNLKIENGHGHAQVQVQAESNTQTQTHVQTLTQAQTQAQTKGQGTEKEEQGKGVGNVGQSRIQIEMESQNQSQCLHSDPKEDSSGIRNKVAEGEGEGEEGGAEEENKEEVKGEGKDREGDAGMEKAKEEEKERPSEKDKQDKVGNDKEKGKEKEAGVVLESIEGKERKEKDGKEEGDEVKEETQEDKAMEEKRKRRRSVEERGGREKEREREKVREREREREKEKGREKEKEKEKKDQKVGKYIVNYGEASGMMLEDGDRKMKRMRVKDNDYERRGDVFSRLKFDEREKEKERERDREKEREREKRFSERIPRDDREERGYPASNRDRERRVQVKEREKYRSHPYKR